MKIWIILLLVGCFFTTYVSCRCAYVTSFDDYDSIENLLVLSHSFSKHHNTSSFDRLLFFASEIDSASVTFLKEKGNWTLKQYPSEYVHYFKGGSKVGLSLLFRLTDYDKVIYLDSKLVVLENIDELCDEDTGDISAMLDVPFADSKVIVLRPDEKLSNLVKGLETSTFMCEKDLILQGLLNTIDAYKPLVIGVSPFFGVDQNILPKIVALPNEYNTAVPTCPAAKILQTGNTAFRPPSWIGSLFIPNLKVWWDEYEEVVKNIKSLLDAKENCRSSLLVTVLAGFFFYKDIAKLYKSIVYEEFANPANKLFFKSYFYLARLFTLCISYLIADYVAYDLLFTFSMFIYLNNVIGYITTWSFLGENGRMVSLSLMLFETIAVRFSQHYGNALSFEVRFYGIGAYVIACNVVCMLWIERHLKNVRKAREETIAIASSNQ